MIVREKPPSIWKLFITLQGSVVPKIWKRVLFFDVLAVAVCVLHLHYGWHFINLTVAPFTIIGLVIGLFLGFRNSVAYERYWEARTLWGGCLIACRNLTRQALVFGQHADANDTRRRIYLLIAFAHALRHRLRGSDGSADLQRWLAADDYAAVAASPSPANTLLTLIGHAFYRLHQIHGLHSPLMANVDKQISELGHILGACERIRTTPVPYAYLLLLHRTVYVYCFLLPFGLVNSVGYMTPVVVSFMVYAFLGLDALGDEITNPFAQEPNALALDSICRTIETHCLAELGEAWPPPLVPDHKGVLM